jgi:hypothetical protein
LEVVDIQHYLAVAAALVAKKTTARNAASGWEALKSLQCCAAAVVLEAKAQHVQRASKNYNLYM